jgi:hypothetical protein
MPIDILAIEPSVISRDLKGKFVFIYGQPKVGKTSLACQFPKNLLLGFEHGWNAIAGAKAIDITKWAEFKLILKQLESSKARDLYDTVTLDTVGIAWDMCEAYICAQNGVQKIGDIPYGAGYSAAKKEFEGCLRKITQMGYGMVVLAHAEKRIQKVDDENELEILSPAIPKRAYDIVNQLVDIIGYIDVVWDEDGNSTRFLQTRRTQTVMAGSRFQYLPSRIKFGYDELVDAITSAIDKEQANGATVVDTIEAKTPELLDFATIRGEAKELWEKLITKDQNNIQTLTKKIEIIFGQPKKLSEVTEDQVDLLNLMVVEMREMIEKEGA